MNDSSNPNDEQPQTRQQTEQNIEERIEKRMSAFERSMLRLTWAAVVISLVTGLIFAGQLYEMWQAGKQTDKLLSAASDLSGAASDTAAAAGDQVDAADNFSDSAEEINSGVSGAVIQLQSAANNAKKSIEATQEAMRLETSLGWACRGKPVSV